MGICFMAMCFQFSNDDSDSGGSSSGQFKYSTTFQLILEFNNMSFAEEVLTQLSNQLDTQSFSDVNAIVKNEKIDAHSNIIAWPVSVICAILEKNTLADGRTIQLEITMWSLKF